MWKKFSGVWFGLLGRVRIFAVPNREKGERRRALFLRAKMLIDKGLEVSKFFSKNILSVQK